MVEAVSLNGTELELYNNHPSNQFAVIRARSPRSHDVTVFSNALATRISFIIAVLLHVTHEVKTGEVSVIFSSHIGPLIQRALSGRKKQILSSI